MRARRTCSYAAFDLVKRNHEGAASACVIARSCAPIKLVKYYYFGTNWNLTTNVPCPASGAVFLIIAGSRPLIPYCTVAPFGLNTYNPGDDILYI